MYQNARFRALPGHRSSMPNVKKYLQETDRVCLASRCGPARLRRPSKRCLGLGCAGGRGQSTQADARRSVVIRTTPVESISACSLVLQSRNLSSPIEMQTHSGSTLQNPVTLTFDILTSVSWMRSSHRVYTILGVDSSSRFPFRAPTVTHTETDRRTQSHRRH